MEAFSVVTTAGPEVVPVFGVASACACCFSRSSRIFVSVAESVVELVPVPRRLERAPVLESSDPVPLSALKRELSLPRPRRESAVAAVEEVAADEEVAELEVPAKVELAEVFPDEVGPVDDAVDVVLGPVTPGAVTAGKPIVGIGVMAGAETVGAVIGFGGRNPV